MLSRRRILSHTSRTCAFVALYFGRASAPSGQIPFTAHSCDSGFLGIFDDCVDVISASLVIFCEHVNKLSILMRFDSATPNNVPVKWAQCKREKKILRHEFFLPFPCRWLRVFPARSAAQRDAMLRDLHNVIKLWFIIWNSTQANIAVINWAFIIE